MKWIHVTSSDERMWPRKGLFIWRRPTDKKVEAVNLVFGIRLPWRQLAFFDYRTRVGYTRMEAWVRFGLVIPRRSAYHPTRRWPRPHIYCGMTPTGAIGDEYVVFKREKSAV